VSVLLNGAVVVDEVIRAAGAREDRPLYVYEDLVVGVGTHEVEVTFIREGDGVGEPDAAADARGIWSPGRVAVGATGRLAPPLAQP
jgi:hypothetical protein